MDTATTSRRVGKTDSWREVEDGPDKWLSEAVADRRCERASGAEQLRARLGFGWALAVAWPGSWAGPVRREKVFLSSFFTDNEKNNIKQVK